MKCRSAVNCAGDNRSHTQSSAAQPIRRDGPQPSMTDRRRTAAPVRASTRRAGSTSHSRSGADSAPARPSRRRHRPDPSGSDQRSSTCRACWAPVRRRKPNWGIDREDVETVVGDRSRRRLQCPEIGPVLATECCSDGAGKGFAGCGLEQLITRPGPDTATPHRSWRQLPAVPIDGHVTDRLDHSPGTRSTGTTINGTKTPTSAMDLARASRSRP